jgi:hypothetical protein
MRRSSRYKPPGTARFFYGASDGRFFELEGTAKKTTVKLIRQVAAVFLPETHRYLDDRGEDCPLRAVS